ncbi:uncharacterized protein TNCV_783031 [Trichonephila clavipes]|nr:uncharacterized protein TNCV_783031 [Trichonephila clavipes]
MTRIVVASGDTSSPGFVCNASDNRSIVGVGYAIMMDFLSPASVFGTTRGLLATDHVILNHGQVTWTTPELAPPLLTTTPHQREDVSALDRFNVHRCPTRRVFSGTGIELVTRQATIRYLYHSATAALMLQDYSPKFIVTGSTEQASHNESLSLAVAIKTYVLQPERMEDFEPQPGSSASTGNDENKIRQI